MSFKMVCDAGLKLGESPVWSVRDQKLYFVDVKGRKLNAYDPKRGFQSYELDEDIGMVAPYEDGFVAAMRSGIWHLDRRGQKIGCVIANPENQAVSRFNDGGTDAKGRLFVGTIDEPKDGGKAHLYRYDHRGLIVIEGGIMTSNGVAFSPDNKTLYHSDTPRFTIYKYDYDLDTGTATNRQVFVKVEPTATDRGRPDGAAVDMEGCYWSAFYEGSRLHRYDPDGKLMSVYPIEAKSPTMPAFGGADMKTLYVTTAAMEGDPHPGGLYAMDVEVAGVVRAPFLV